MDVLNLNSVFGEVTTGFEPVIAVLQFEPRRPQRSLIGPRKRVLNSVSSQAGPVRPSLRQVVPNGVLEDVLEVCILRGWALVT
jgi:hypothetical protein